jgi:hypothetical protein
MTELLFLFPRDSDLSAVDEFLESKLVPQLKNAAGVRSIRISVDTIMSPGGPPPYARALGASFDSLADVAVVEESKAHPAERERLAGLGPLILLYDAKEEPPWRIDAG